MFGIGYMRIETRRVTRCEWWNYVGMPLKLRKGDPDDMGFMWKEPNSSIWRWMPEAEFRNQYDV